MFDVLGDINWLAVLLSTVAYAVLGGVWFAVLFPRPYAVALGRDASPATPVSPLFYAGPAVCSLATSLATAILMEALGIGSVGDALLLGLIVGVGFLVATTYNVAINPNVPRPLLYGLVSGGYFLVACLISSLILVAFM